MRTVGLPILSLLLLALPAAGLAQVEPPLRGAGGHRIHALFGFAFDPDAVGLSLGGTDVLDDAARGEASWEIQFPSHRIALWPKKWPEPHPLAGVLATTDGSVYPYVGISVRLPLTSRFWFTPSLSAGAYVHAGGFDLGAPIEFRSRAEVVYQLSVRNRIGLSFGHLSNSGIRRRNPGTETLSLTFYSSLKNHGWTPD
ncbi:MAG TPA: acyloxyacyl hydrolase [Thermoanaerobaculia bacterium]|nr:acyloxyacyl hydrolase [Thermoanaerobaculia bacterium]